MSHLLPDPLPTLQEDEESVSLTDVLDLRRGCLREAELWAICKEGALSLEAFRRASADLFARLCLSPDTLAFDSAGGVCFIDTDTVDHNFRPPEYTKTKGTSLKGHLYSLARTLLEAAEYCLPDDNEAEISQPLYELVSWLAAEDPAQRPEASQVVKVCERNLDDPSTLLCRQLSSISRRKISIDSCYDFPVNEDPYPARRPSTSSQVLFSRRQSLCNGTSWDSLSPSDVFSLTPPPASPAGLRPGSPTAIGMAAEAESGWSARPAAGGAGDRPLGSEPIIREAPTAAALNNLSQRAQDILKKIYASSESQPRPGTLDGGSPGGPSPGKKDPSDGCKRSPFMRRVNSIASMGGSGGGNPAATSHPPPPASKPQEAGVPVITVLPARETNGQGTGSEGSPTPNSVKVSAALARFMRSRKQQSTEEALSACPADDSDSAALTKEEVAAGLGNDSGDEYSGSTEPLSPLGTEDFSLLDGDLMLDDPWLDAEESDEESPVNFKRTLRSHSIAAFHSFEARNSAFRLGQSAGKSSSASIRSSRASLDDITEEQAKAKLDAAAAKRARRKAENTAAANTTASVATSASPSAGTDIMSYTSIRDLNRLQDFFANRRSSIADFRAPAAVPAAAAAAAATLVSKATHFTPIAVADPKSASSRSLTRSASSPTMEGAKAKARAAMEAIKMDLKAPRKQPPPPNMLESLENDAVASRMPSPTDDPSGCLPDQTPPQATPDGNKLHHPVPVAESTPNREKTVDENSAKEANETQEAGNARALVPRRDPSELHRADGRKASLELEGLALTNSGAHQPDPRNLLTRDGTSSGEPRVQKPKVKVVQGSPISRDSAFSPIQKPPRLVKGPEGSGESGVSGQPDLVRPTAFQARPAAKVLNNQCNQAAGTTHQSPASTSMATAPPVQHIQNNLFGHQASPVRLASSPLAGQPPPASPTGPALPTGFPLQVHLRQDPATGLFHVLPVDLQGSPVISHQGSPVFAQGLPASSLGPTVPAVAVPQIAVTVARLEEEMPTGLAPAPPPHRQAGKDSPVAVSPAVAGDPAAARAQADKGEYWRSPKSPGASSDGESTCIPVTPDLPRKETADLRRRGTPVAATAMTAATRKRHEAKAKHLVSPSKRTAQAKGASSRRSRANEESESSESSYLESLRPKGSPKAVSRKKPSAKASSSHSDPDRQREKAQEQRSGSGIGTNKSHSHERSDDTKSRSRSCERPKGALSLRRADGHSPRQTPDKLMGHAPRPHSSHKISHRPRDNHAPPAARKPGSRSDADDVDDTRPLPGPARERPAPPGGPASPVSMSSLSRDSGVNLRYSMSSGEELPPVSEARLADALQGNARLKAVIKLVRQAFAYDGYLENGVEDLAMAEYITSLGKLSWPTFNNAVSEKFCDLYWEEELLISLYEAVNGQKPAASRPTSETPPKSRLSSVAPKKPARTKASRDSHSSSNRKASPLATGAGSERKTSPAAPAAAAAKGKGESQGRSKVMGSRGKEPADEENRNVGEAVGSGRGAVAAERKDGGATSATRMQSKEAATSHQRMNGLGPRSRSPATSQPRTEQRRVATNSPLPDARRSLPESLERVGKQGSQQPLSDEERRGREESNRGGRASERGVAASSAASSSSFPSSAAGRKLTPDRTDGDAGRETRPGSVGNGSLEGRPDGTVPGWRKDGGEPSGSGSHLALAGLSPDESSSSFSLDPDSSRASPTSSLASSSFLGRDEADGGRPALVSPILAGHYYAPAWPRAAAAAGHHGGLALDPRASSPSSASLSSGHSSSLGHARRPRPPASRAASGSDTISLPSLGDSSLGESAEEGRCGLARGVLYRGEGVDPTVEAYTQQLAPGAGGTQQTINAKIADVEQQLMMEKRMRSKTEKFYRKLLYNQQTKGSGSDQKHMVSKVGKQILEMAKRIDFLESSKKHLEMLYAEQWGLELDHLHTLATSTGKMTLDLQPHDPNPLLAFQASRNKVALQAGQPSGLISFLYARHALLQGYLPHFFYTYHYFATAHEVFEFIVHRFTLALRLNGQHADVRTRIMCRTLDILQVWVEGFFEVDFRTNPSLLQDLLIFVTEKVVPVDPNGQCLVQLIDKHQRDLPGTSLIVATQREDKRDQLPLDKSLSSSKDSRGLLGTAGRGKLKAGIMACLSKREPATRQADTAYLPALSMERDGFSLGDHTSLALAHQLTLLQQELFHRMHPVHYLNSRSKGIGVNTNHYEGSGLKGGAGAGPDAHEAPSLFAGSLGDGNGGVRALLGHARDIAHWVSAEIVSCSSTKAQLVLLCKFINVAKACYDLRNYASCVQILESLDSLIVRQVPAWRNLPSKVVTLYEELVASKVLLQGDGESLVRGDAHRGGPTLPPTLLFLMHVQQLEIGNFRLANGMYKWTKMRCIAKFVDQVRVFQEHAFTFEANGELQSLLRQRILDCCDQDIQVLAARHSSNVHPLPSDKGSRRLQNAFQKVRATLH